MNRIDREWAVKLDLLESIARSQASLAEMLEHAAKVTTAVELAPARIREHLRAMASMQDALLSSATGIRWRRPRRGVPGNPWLAAKVRARQHNRNIAGGDS